MSVFSKKAVERLARFIAAVREGESFSISLQTQLSAIEVFTIAKIPRERRSELARVLGVEVLELDEKPHDPKSGYLVEHGSADADGTAVSITFYNAERRDALEPCVEREKKAKEVSA